MDGERTIVWHNASKGKKNLNASLTDNEGIEFPIGSMVVKGEYLTLDGKSRKTSGYVFMDY